MFEYWGSLNPAYKKREDYHVIIKFLQGRVTREYLKNNFSTLKIM